MREWKWRGDEPVGKNRPEAVGTDCDLLRQKSVGGWVNRIELE